MNTQLPPDSFDHALLQAAAWHATLLSPDAAAEVWAAFTAWLEQDDRNRDAYAAVERLYGQIDACGDALPALVAAASASRLPRPRAWIALGLACLAGCLGAAGWLVSRPAPDAGATAIPYATSIGDVRHITLADGTLAELNSLTQLEVSFTAQRRRVRIAAGEVRFQVKRETSRAFEVQAGPLLIRDIGTVFDVLRTPHATAITVVAGRISVTQASASGVTLLQAGDHLIVQDGASPLIQHIDAASATSWADGYLVYDNAPLAQVVGDLNRRFGSRVTLQDNQTAAQEFSGVLKLDSEDAVLQRLVRLLPLALNRGADGSVTLHLRPR